MIDVDRESSKTRMSSKERLAEWVHAMLMEREVRRTRVIKVLREAKQVCA